MLRDGDFFTIGNYGRVYVYAAYGEPGQIELEFDRPCRVNAAMLEELAQKLRDEVIPAIPAINEEIEGDAEDVSMV